MPTALISSPMSDYNGGGSRGYLLFVWSPSGYTLRDHDGEVPHVGDELDGGLLVTKIGPSPVPGDSRPCVYSMGKG
jgi:hypothetical protein